MHWQIRCEPCIYVLCVMWFLQVARGNSFLHIDKGPEAGTQCVLQAMKKFTGGLGDDDDREMGDNLVWKKYFTKV